MGTYKRTEGQTIIETAFMLVLLLLILFGITEFSRAWYTKNSLKNAARSGARVAVVTSTISAFADQRCPTTTTPPTPCSSANLIVDTVCCKSPGVPRNPENNTTVDLIVDMTTEPPTDSLNAGDTITVRARTTFDSVVSSSFFPWLQNINISTDASMRYE